MTMSSINRESHKLISAGMSVMADKYPRLFMGMQHHRTTSGKRMTFSDKPWLTAIYKDNSREMVIVKSSQVHLTEHALCAMYTFAKRGLRGMYVMPSGTHRKTFVYDRIDRMKSHSPLYAEAVENLDDKKFDSNVYKMFFGAGWKFVGSNVRGDFFEFPCDVLFFDEYDLLNQENIVYAYDRLANSHTPIVWQFGNPTREGFGILREYAESDQKEWHVGCETCGHEQILDWYANFVEKRDGGWALRNQSGYAVCTECDEPFNRMGRGRWIALNPSLNSEPKKASGYRVSRLFVDKRGIAADIQRLFNKFIKAQNNPVAMQNFHNNYLAIEYENVEFRMDEALLQKSAVRIETMFDAEVFRSVMGVDQGKKYTCTVSIVLDGVIHDVCLIEVDTWAQVEALESTYNVVCTVIDAQGGGYAETRDFVKKKGYRWMCYYRAKDQIKTPVCNRVYDEQTLETNRTELLDLMVKSYKDGKTKVPLDWRTCAHGQFVKQMCVPSRVTDAGGRPVWTKGADHFFHASAYRWLAYHVCGMKNSVASGRGWHAGGAEQRTPEPKERVIGGDGKHVMESAVETTKRRKRWHVS